MLFKTKQGNKTANVREDVETGYPGTLGVYWHFWGVFVASLNAVTKRLARAA